jgi:hypothetical protein
MKLQHHLIVATIVNHLGPTRIKIVEVNIEALVPECVKFHDLPIDALTYSSNLQA